MPQTGLFPASFFCKFPMLNFLHANHFYREECLPRDFNWSFSLNACRKRIILHLLSRLVGLKGDCQADMATLLFKLLLILYINSRDRNRCLLICVQRFEKILEIWHPSSRGVQNSLGAGFDYQIRRLVNIVWSDPLSIYFHVVEQAPVDTNLINLLSISASSRVRPLLSRIGYKFVSLKYQMKTLAKN